MLIRLASTACAAGIVTTLLAAAPVSPEGGVLAPNTGVADTREQVRPGAAVAPRKLLRKPRSEDLVLPVHPITGRPQWNGRLGVKFRDEVGFRADLVPGANLRGGNAESSKQVTELLASFGGSIRSMLRAAPEKLVALQARAEAYSRVSQPDLQSMMYVDVQPERLLDAARAFNSLDIVEWVDIEREPVLDGGTNNAQQDGCGANGPADGTGINNCYTTSADSRCSTLGGGQGCNDVQACQAPDGALPACRYGCNNTQCCETVGDILPNCTDGEQAQGWDALCATYANILCESTVYDTLPAIQGSGGSTVSTPTSYKYDPCFAMRGPVNPTETDVRVYGEVETIPDDPAGNLGGQLLTYTTDPATGAFNPGSLTRIAYPGGVIGDEADPSTDVPQQALPDPSLEGAYLALSAGCFSEHTFGGCNQVSCCVYVCRTDPSCCSVEWDEDCVSLAEDAPEGVIAGSPCTGQTLPTNVFPTGGVTPLLTAGRENGTGAARGYQNYVLAQSVVGPFDTLPAGVTYPVQPPSVNARTTPDPTRTNVDSNLGTFAVINSGYRGGGLDMEGYANLVTQLGITADTRAFGQRIKVAVIEFSAYVNHEDLVNKVQPEPNQTQVLIISDPLNPNHGTSVLGIIGAEKNGFGVTGIAWGCTPSFFPTVSVEEGSRLNNALTNAILELAEGDIINMSIGFGGGNTIVASPAVFTIVQVGTSAGVTSICSAGNDASPVVTSPDGESDSGAVIVGACWPGYQVGQLTQDISIPGPFPGSNYCRLNFSNFTDLEGNGGQVDVAAWGTGVTTVGYGDLFNGDNAPVDDPLELNKLRSYTAQFNGTSAAAPIIAGWCACVQGFCKQWFGAPLPPGALRAQISGNVFRQCGQDYANPNFPGYPETGTPAVGDIEPGGAQARIGGFPNTRTTISSVIASTFGGTSVQFDIITGTYDSGSSFSIRQLDGSPLRINAERRRAGSRGQGYGSSLLYPLTGGTTDLQLAATSTSAPSQVSAIGLLGASFVSWNTPTMEIVYFYNFTQQRWVSGGNVVLGAAPPAEATRFFPPGDLANFVTGTPNGGSRVYARVYTCGLGNTAYTILHDQLSLEVTVDIFGP